MRAVNLLPRDLERARSERTRVPLIVLFAGLAVVTVLAAMLTLSSAGTVSDRRGDLQAAESALEAASANSGRTAPAQGLVVQERTDRVAALAAALSSRVPLDGLLRQLAYVLPADAWLTGLAATSADDSATTRSAAPSGSSGTPPASAGTPTGTSLTIDGATFSQESVARVLARLAVLPSLEDVRLTKSERVDPQAATAQPGADASVKPKSKKKKQESVVVFSITASYARGVS